MKTHSLQNLLVVSSFFLLQSAMGADPSYSPDPRAQLKLNWLLQAEKEIAAPVASTRLEQTGAEQKITPVIAKEPTTIASPKLQVMITGKVVNPGWFEIPKGETLMLSAAIQTAGGLDNLADDHNVVVYRNSVDRNCIKVDLNAVLKSPSHEKDLKLETADIIVVGELTPIEIVSAY